MRRIRGSRLRRVGSRVVLAVALACTAAAAFSASAQAVSFQPAVNYTTANTPVGVAVGHFNGDAHADLAVANLISSNVSILLGTGTGTFGAGTNYSTGAGSRGIAIGDFNGDANEDLAVVNATANNVSILLGTGTGTFGTATNYPVGTSPRQVAVRDFDGDGKLDLAVANATTNNVSILLGTGTGTFGAATNFAAGTSPRSVAVSDYNGDGKLDLAVANATSNDVSVLLGTGTGTFGTATNFAAGTEPRMVISGDFNGDSKRDLAVADNGSNDVSVLLGNGIGGFGAAASYGAGTGPVALTRADFNGDGKDDLAVANNGSANASVLLGTGTGTFGTASNFATTSGPAWIAVGQLNGGTQPDIVVPGGTTLATSFVSVLLGQAEPSLTTSADSSGAIGGSIRDTATISGGSSPTGTIVFKAYGPDDADCSGTPAFTSAAVDVSGNGSYQSPPFTPPAQGTYRWIAAYSGDSENAAVAGACNDSGESSVVGKATPALSTNATTTATVGEPIHDSATISGGSSPTGTIVFKAYGPADPNCSGAAAFTSSPVTVNAGNGTYQSPDFVPGGTGTYRWIASYSGDSDNAAVAGACNDPNENTVVSNLPTPSLSTTATAAVAFGGTIHDSATISGGNSPTGTIVFRVYGPGDATCSAAPVFTSSPVDVDSGNGTYQSPGFSPAHAGTYRWIATYSGDGQNNSAAGSCNDAGETSVVARQATSIATSADSGGPAGSSIKDRATLSGGASPTGTIVFKAYGPDDANCSGTPAFTSSAVAVSGNGSYDSPSFTPTAIGTYRWIASYSGDSDNQAASGSCNDPNESSVITKTVPSFSDSADASVILGQSIRGRTTISGGSSPTGTIVFKAYGPDDANCSGTPAFTSPAVTVNGNTTYASATYQPTTAGIYRWIASYSGDAANAAVEGSCNDPGSTSTVNKRNPTVTTSADATATVGSEIRDHATISGGLTPSGTIVFRAYGPSDPDCSGSPAFTGAAVPVSGAGTYSSPPFTPASTGTYRWIATYSGDANNQGSAGACNATGETTTVTKRTPSLAGTASADVELGGSLSDRATISGGHAPTGTIVFKAYGPDDANCSGTPAFTSSAVAVSGNGSYDSPSFKPTAAGTYRWIASYSGDGNNEAVAGTCNASGQAARVTGKPPAAKVSFGALKLDKKRGTGTQEVKVSGPGSVRLDSKQLKAATVQAKSAGTVKVALRPAGKYAKKLKKRGSLSVDVAVTFSPKDGGDPKRVATKLKLKKKTKKK